MAPLPQSLGVFCGPSLPEIDRLFVPGVTYLPPAARGDIAREMQRFTALLLIDGVFHHDIAPSPKEVYAACRSVRMFGGASMGALRAAECRPFGMVPLGIIARWYVREIIDGDDEVAVLVDPQTQRALTVPSVNVRHLARLAQRCGLFNHGEAGELVRRSRNIFYMDRTWDDVVALAPTATHAALRKLVPYADLKRTDAMFAVRSATRAVRRDVGNASSNAS